MESTNLSRRELEIDTLRDKIQAMSERECVKVLLIIVDKNIIPDTLLDIINDVQSTNTLNLIKKWRERKEKKT